jgi:hypothetical protein
LRAKLGQREHISSESAGVQRQHRQGTSGAPTEAETVVGRLGIREEERTEGERDELERPGGWVNEGGKC